MCAYRYPTRWRTKHIPTVHFTHVHIQTDAYFTNWNWNYLLLVHVSTRNYAGGDSNPRDLSLSPSNASFHNHIPSLTLSLLTGRYTAHSRNGKLYLSSGTGPCKLETDDVRVNLSRISLCRFCIVKYFPPPGDAASDDSRWTRSEIQATRRRFTLEPTQIPPFMRDESPRNAPYSCTDHTTYVKRTSDATSTLATAAKCVDLIQWLKLNGRRLSSPRPPHLWRWRWQDVRNRQ